MSEIGSVAVQADKLQQRIAENALSQQIDLATWIFDRVRVTAGSRVLELCCGTGAQTLPMLERVGSNGQVVALDLSDEALRVLSGKAASLPGKLKPIASSLEDFSVALRKVGIEQHTFDLIFCAYGLYYSSNSVCTLEQAREWSSPGGRIAIIGPFGPNNKELFDLVLESGAKLSEAVIDSSERFMLQTVLPWGAVNFERANIHTMVNPVRWTSPDRVINYWRNTTFYDETKLPAFQKLLDGHFAKHDAFENRKWVMLVEFEHVR